MENKSLKKGQDNLPFPQHYNTELGDYETTQGKNGASFVEVRNSNAIKVSLDNASIALPVELRGVEKTFLFGTRTNLGANAVFISPPYDVTTVGKIGGIISTSHAGTLYIQESDDSETWYNTHTLPTTVSTATTISSVSYNSAQNFQHLLNAKYLRLIYVNGATAQTKFHFSAYTLSN